MKALFTWILAIVMFAQSLTPRAAIELLRSTDVWAHYREHQEEQSQPLSLLDFLWMHYSVDSDHTKQKKHHLPSFDFNSVASFFVVPSAWVSLDKKATVSVLTSANFHWLNSYAFLTFKALICPPRA